MGRGGGLPAWCTVPGPGGGLVAWLRWCQCSWLVELCSGEGAVRLSYMDIWVGQRSFIQSSTPTLLIGFHCQFLQKSQSQVKLSLWHCVMMYFCCLYPTYPSKTHKGINALYANKFLVYPFPHFCFVYLPLCIHYASKSEQCPIKSTLPHTATGVCSVWCFVIRLDSGVGFVSSKSLLLRRAELGGPSRPRVKATRSLRPPTAHPEAW